MASSAFEKQEIISSFLKNINYSIPIFHLDTVEEYIPEMKKKFITFLKEVREKYLYMNKLIEDGIITPENIHKQVVKIK